MAGAYPNPRLTYQTENGPFPGGTARMGLDREISIFATLPLEPLFQRGPRTRQADEEVNAAAALVVATRRQVVLEAARAFYRVALAQAAVQASREILERLDAAVGYKRARVAEGVTAESDLIGIEVEVDRLSATAALEEAELFRARAALQPYLEGEPTARPDVAALEVAIEDSAEAITPLPAMNQFVAYALANRPDLVAARARAAAASADVALQRTLTLRQLELVFGAKRASGANTMVAGLSLPLPVFDRNDGGRQRAAGERTAFEQELTWAERMASAEVGAAYQAAALLNQQVDRLRGGFLGRAEESGAMVLAAYEEGTASLLQVLDASRSLAEARLTYYRTLFAGQQSLLELSVAAGLDPTARLPAAAGGAPTAPVTPSPRAPPSEKAQQ
jgi:cobalt-zinc-cadmium efflux system outer membrane protein